MNDKKIIKKLNKSFNFLVNNPYSSFYQDKYKKTGLRLKAINTFEDFNSLPYLTKDEILNVSPYDFIFTNPRNISDVGITSGTTNKDTPLLLLSDINIRPSINTDRFDPLIKLKVKCHMLLYPPMTAAAKLRRNGNLIKKGIINVTGDLSNLSLTAKIAKRLEIGSIETTPSILYLFIPYLKKEYDLDKIRAIMIGGEYCSEQKFKYLKSVFKKAHFIIDFGSIETGAMASRCKYLEKKPIRFFHPADHVYVETLNQEEEGELVVSGLEAGKIPYLLRYRTGNHVKITDYKCPCGESILMEVFGKIGFDVLFVQGTFIYSNLIHEILSPFSRYLQVTDFKLHVYEVIKGNRIMTKLVMQLLPKKGLEDLNLAKKEINLGMDHLILTPQNTLSDLVKKGVYLPLKIEFVDTFPVSAKRTSIISHIV